MKNNNFSFDSKNLTSKELVQRCTGSIKRNGFCVIENVIPSEEVQGIRQEILEAQEKIQDNIKLIKKILNKNNFNEKDLLENKSVQLRSVGRIGRPSKPPNDIIWMPKYAKHLANTSIVKIARDLLDDHIRIVQLHPKIIFNTPEDKSSISLKTDNLGLPRIYKGPVTARDWHTDWPHDPSANGGKDPNENIGYIRPPYPDITMCLVVVWYFNDVDENSGGTFAVPGSHRDLRTPRGPSDGITVTAPIPGEIQIKAKAGSVFIQDARTWHSAPLHNFSANKRVAVVSRWCPWWLSANDFAPKSRFNVICRPLSHSEFLDLPSELQPFMKHLCPEEIDAFPKQYYDRAQAAAERTRWAYKKLEEKHENLLNANAKIRVKIPNSKKTKN